MTERATSAESLGAASGHLTPLTGGSKPFIYATRVLIYRPAAPLIAGLAGIVLLVTEAILVPRRRRGGDAGLEPVDADQQEQVPAKDGGVT